MKLYDAHNHLQDDRLASHLEDAVSKAQQQGVARMVVNGSCESDWPQVLELARRFPVVLPSFGYHPWYVKERAENWKSTLTNFLDQVPSTIGEIGLDRWIPDFDLPAQEKVFLWQLQLAAARNLPVSIHCLRAWGRLQELLRDNPRPACGFLLHSYGGPMEMVAPLAKLGAYFSISGHFANERKARQAETFRHVPPDRLLIETDAPDMWPPEKWNEFPMLDSSGKSINHPANLASVYRFAAELLGESIELLASRVEENFLRLFDKLCH